MNALPVSLLVILATLIFFSRPYLEARRPFASLALVIGAGLGYFLRQAGPSGARMLPDSVSPALEVLLALSAGWLATLAAEAFDLPSLRRAHSGHLLALILGVGLIAAVAAAALPANVFEPVPAEAHSFADAAAGSSSPGIMLPPFLLARAVLLALIAIAAYPLAVRDALSRATHPDAAARQAPMLASLAQGLALGGAALAWALHASEASRGSTLTWLIPAHVVATAALGIGAGLFFSLLLRLSQGKGPILSALVAMQLLTAGAARYFGMSPLAVLFIAGMVLANDATRRDFVFTYMKELERPFLLAMMMLAGAGIPLGGFDLTAGLFIGTAAVFILARAAAWRFAGHRVGLYRMMPLSPLVIPLALDSLAWKEPAARAAPDALVAIATLAFIISDATWTITRFRNGKAQVPIA